MAPADRALWKFLEPEQLRDLYRTVWARGLTGSALDTIFRTNNNCFPVLNFDDVGRADLCTNASASALLSVYNWWQYYTPFLVSQDREMKYCIYLNFSLID